MDKFNLNWTGFSDSLSGSLRTFKRDEDLVDVTLVTEDEKLFSAHKVVLAASCGFFQNIFKSRLHSHPLIYLSESCDKKCKCSLD